MTKEQYENHLMRISGGARSGIQKLKDASQNAKQNHSNHKARIQKNNDSDGRTVQVVFYVSDRRRRDLDNMIGTCMDCLVQAGILPDDNIFEVRSIWASWERCEKGQEGVSVKILEKNA